MTDLKTAARMALAALEQYTAKELTVGQRYTNEGQGLLDATAALRAACQQIAAEALAGIIQHEIKADKDVPLPEPVNRGQSLVGGIPRPWEPLFATAQVLAYGDARAAAEQERCAMVCDLHSRPQEEIEAWIDEHMSDGQQGA
jgi:hypothetical protein